MYKIQHTIVSDVGPNRARLEMQISDHEVVEKSEQFLVFSLLIDRPESASDFESMQSRALSAAKDLLDTAKEETAKNRPSQEVI